ncbi:CynX/NimT family MFS transporter [Streptomyces sp. CMB-StM0423]|uniref:CynX/NimT family MFS transporter n=1 Tax=Streptomyces sp. CMB-StM0423 TaxID=2059884 RepID=UPI000C712F65|nr:MFS transporter [Streptomyces sp. CMB-StM0423]AUH43742.1 MFS transporter [Streptomyces sp. CMB-StM0423]
MMVCMPRRSILTKAAESPEEPTGQVRATEPPPASGPAAAPRTAPWLLPLMVPALLLAAVNLRPAIASLGALLEDVRTDIGMSGTVAGLLTSMPALCFAVFGSLAPRFARRFGPVAVVAGGLVAIAGGLALRPLFGNTPAFLAASALALGGIAVGNVLIPVIVKRWFPDRVGSMTGLYSMGLALGTASAAGATVPVSEALGGSWRLGLGLWAAVAVLAVVPWVVLSRGSRRTAAAETGGADAGAPAAEPARGVRITASPTAWALAVFFGLQATAAYVILGWLPQIYRDAGVPASTAGLLLALAMGLGVPLAFVLPRIAARLHHQGPLVVVLGLCGLGGYAGLWLAPAGGAWVWALLLAVSNCAFPLVLTLLGVRARSHAGLVRLSAFAQSTGYLISIPGPLAVGALYGATDGWTVPLAVLAAFMVAQVAVGIVAGRDRVVEDEV